MGQLKSVLSKEEIELLRLKFFDRANDAVYVFDFEDGTILDANEHVMSMLGYTRDELLQLNVFDIHPEEERQRMLDLIDIFRQVGQVKGVSDMHLKRKDGTWIPVEKNGSLFSLNERKVIQCTCRDITRRKMIEAELNKRVEDMHILNSVALEITSGHELQKLLPKITQSAVELLNADAGAIGFYNPRKGSLIYHYLYNLPEDLASIEIPGGAGLTSFVLDTARPISIPDYASYPKAIKEFKKAGIRATTIAPLRIENKLLGTIVVAHKHPEKKFNEYDTSLLEAIARQAAIGIYNAQLFEEMKDEGEFRQSLSQLTSLIGSALDISKVYDLLCEEGTKLFKSNGTYLYIVDKNKGTLIGKAAYGKQADEFLRVKIPISDPSMATYIYHTRKPVLIDDVAGHPLIKHDLAHQFSSRTLMGVPIIVDGDVKSVLVFSSSQGPYFFSENMLERAKILSNQVAFAIKNADLYRQTREALEHERYVAVTLQQSLLPMEVPHVEGAEIGAYYVPMHEGEALVGGDFYDFIQLADGRLAIIIGDVSGKGIEAAAVTAMVKYAIRSFIYKNPTPEFALTQANNVVSMQLRKGSFVSLCYLLYDPGTGKIILANAGHPYPIFCSDKGKACKLITSSNPVFGLTPNYDYNQIEGTLEDDDILVFYTDGLTEARANNEFFDTQRAQLSVTKNHNLSAQDITVNLINDCKEFARGNLSDDVAILVLKRHSE